MGTLTANTTFPNGSQNAGNPVTVTVNYVFPIKLTVSAETQSLDEQFVDDVHHPVANRFRMTRASCILDASAIRRAAYVEAHRRSG